MTPMNKAASRLHATSHSPAVQVNPLSFTHVYEFATWLSGKVGGPRGTDQRWGRVVLVDEHRTTRVSSAVNGQQPCEEELDHEQPTRPKRSKRTKAEPAAEPTQPTKGKCKAKGKAAKAKPAPQPCRWLDRDCNAALNMQRIGERRWRPLELCYWPDQGALPAKGKEYPGLGCKRLRDKPPMAQQQQQQPVKAQ
ncbi:hypothetical protein QJQ45_007080 [Haematococcus lacustris]|nr:hypothetical protein QJQ45_007080 [Haematococcus lacustris]